MRRLLGSRVSRHYLVSRKLGVGRLHLAWMIEVPWADHMSWYYKTHDLSHIFFVPPLLLVSDLSRIDSGGRDGEILAFFGILGFPKIPFALPVLLLLSFFGFIKKLKILGRSGCGSECKAPKSPGVIAAMIFNCSLGLDFVCDGMSRSIPSETTQISLLHVKTPAEARLGLGPHCLFYQLFIVNQLGIVLVHPSFDGWL